MIHFCMFGGYDGRLGNDKRVYLTLFGGSDLKKPTVARSLLSSRSSAASAFPPVRPWIITLFGGTDIKCPTLAEEFLDLRDLLMSGRVTRTELDRHFNQNDHLPDSSYVSITLFGGLDENQLPSENEEIDALALQRHLGNIQERCGEILQLGIGMANTERWAVVRRAIDALV